MATSSSPVPTRHGFCTIHRIGYNRDFEATCPQCTLAHMQPGTQLDYDEVQQKPISASGKLLDARTLREIA